jgi:3-hydroxyacyl-[acyl-carrier-protein] dehydratase
MDPRFHEALDALPHGPEFRFLDALTALVPGRSGTGVFTVPQDAPYLRGHFPGNPLFPGVLLVEAAAQLAGVVAQSDPEHPPIPGLKLAAIRAARISGSARPGESLRLEADILGRLGNVIQARVTVAVADRRVLQLELALGGS